MNNDLDDFELREEIRKALGLPAGALNHSISTRVKALIVRDLQRMERIHDLEGDIEIMKGGTTNTLKGEP